MLDILLERQSAHLGGKRDGTICLAVTNPIQKSYLSLGRKGGEKYKIAWFPEKPMEMQPTRLDMELWPTLDSVSDLTGAGRYRNMVTAMAEAFARHGFDPRWPTRRFVFSPLSSERAYSRI